jgi:hypothetical protein
MLLYYIRVSNAVHQPEGKFRLRNILEHGRNLKNSFYNCKSHEAPKLLLRKNAIFEQSKSQIFSSTKIQGTLSPHTIMM